MNEGNNALQVVDDHSPAVFDTKDPGAVIGKATGIANQLAPIVEKAKLYSMISGKKYVKVEGWNTMLSMLGIFPQVEYCRKLDRADCAYEARVVLKTIGGQVVGAGEALCSSTERNWGSRDEFAIKSMAQTRATGKAARNGFSWIMALAGYEACPAEEMPHHDEAKPIPANPAPTRQEKREHAPLELHTSRFVLSDPITSKKGTVYRKAQDADGSNFYVWDDAVCADLQVVGDREVTVEWEPGKFPTIKRVLPQE
jgi:hypothetical protein